MHVGVKPRRYQTSPIYDFDRSIAVQRLLKESPSPAPCTSALSIAGRNAVSQADLRGIVKFFVTCFDWPWPPPCSASPCQCGDNLNSLQPFGNSDSNGEHLGGQRHLNTVVALVNRTFSKFVGGGAGRAGRGIQAFCKERDSLWKQPRLKSLFVSFSFGSMRESTTL